ncbi:MAG: fumarylacetoacetate hydrolase family protein [Clostridia bacterium]|nr:fumarylacetoacetate hydrolase family protein [Clostridia bacterium]
MKLVTYEYMKKTGIGILNAAPEGNTIGVLEGLTSLTEIMGMEEKKIRSFYTGENIAYDKARILAPIPEPVRDIICLGVNYLDHAEESARFKAADFNGPREYPAYFGKRVDRATGDRGIIPWHGDVDDRLDYEVELALIIGKTAKRVSRDNALDYVFGYTILNDVTARTIQQRHLQWYAGKSLDGYCPMGPCVVTKNDLDYNNLNIRSYVNGELRQSSNTSKQIFDIPYVISELSQMITLQKGTIISTGTPAGVGAGFDPPKTLHPGDEVVCEIEGIGRLTNIVETPEGYNA